MSRMRKFKRYKQFVTLWKVTAICYISIFTLGYLASGTGAYFVSSQENEQIIQAGTWWDGSELAFIGDPKADETSCPQVNLSVGLKNKGFSMTEPTTYEVFFSKQGNPDKKGEKVGSGEIVPLDQNETTTLTYTAEKEGFYIFKTYQHSLYEEETDKASEVWSKKVKVKCKEKKVKEEEKIEEVEKDQVEEVQTEENEQQESAENNKDNKEQKTVETEKAPEEDSEVTPETKQNNEQNTESSKQEGKEEQQTEKETQSKKAEKSQEDQKAKTQEQPQATEEEEGE
ncbi:amyloid fiber anchoring/assembly protein TapA [Oceanobacillus manasiensis]|uniref:amyloid fiber anchoring/assembly protein TapA n=1 Tax=Oceanobacillus manasiensis TaxID=586413 RepID=UPI0018DC31E9|nr:amyloid fiber anchoring/assembly protein TapA [Oceanobacillus manasiensis]